MLVAHLGSNAFYYSGLAYGLGRKGSAHFLRQFLLNYVDPGPSALRVLGCVALFALVVAHASARGQRGNQQWSSVLVSAWLAGGIPLFLIAVLRTAADPSPALYVLPGAFIALTTPTRAEGPFETRRLTGLSGPLAVVALVIGVHAARSCWRGATDPGSDQRPMLGLGHARDSRRPGSQGIRRGPRRRAVAPGERARLEPLLRRDRPHPFHGGLLSLRKPDPACGIHGTSASMKPTGGRSTQGYHRRR